MGVIALSDQQVWKVAHHEFRRLLDSAGSILNEADAFARLSKRKQLDGLHLDKSDNHQAKRLRAALLAAADQVAMEIEGAPETDSRDEQFVIRLDELRRLLEQEGPSGENG